MLYVRTPFPYQAKPNLLFIQMFPIETYLYDGCVDTDHLRRGVHKGHKPRYGLSENVSDRFT